MLPEHLDSRQSCCHSLFIGVFEGLLSPSLFLIRIPASATKPPMMKGILHVQAMYADPVNVSNKYESSAAVVRPRGLPCYTQLEHQPPFWELAPISTTHVAAPPVLPPSPSPWISLSTPSKIGVAAPSVTAPGRVPYQMYPLPLESLFSTAHSFVPQCRPCSRK